MRRVFNALAVALLVGAGAASVDVASAQPRAAESTTPQVPRCTQNLGTISIQNGDTYQGWRQWNLQPPAGLLRIVIQQSGCFTVVERGAGLDAAMRERELAGGGQLQRGSNVGGGQVRAADYVMLADVVAQDNNSSGGGVGAALGGYTDTEIGRVVTVAFIDAYTQLITQLGVLDSSAAAAAPQRTYRTTQATAMRSRAGGGSTLRNLPAGATVYPLGEREGLWWRVEDENENQGWVTNDHLEPVS